MKLTSTLLLLASCLSGLSSAQLNPPAGTIITRCNRPGVIALTFDDGPGPNMNTLINTLNSAGAKATFFVTGTLYGCIHNRAAWVKQAYDSGHQIASHTWSHPNLSGYSSQQITTEMQRLEGALNRILGGVKPTYMRPPYLATGGNVQSTLGGLGYRIITCDVDTQDWNNLSAQQSFQRLQQSGAGGNGHIPLMHETVASTPSQLAPLVINWAKQNNLKMVTVADCLGDTKPYVPATVAATSNC